MKRRVVFLDRDGTLNEDLGYVHRIADWRFAPQAAEAVRMLRDAGFAVALVSNQAGIARGLFTAAAVDELHTQVRELLVRRGADLDAVAYCPHGRTRAVTAVSRARDWPARWNGNWASPSTMPLVGPSAIN